MRRVLGIATGLVFVLSTSSESFADFQYRETSKITGGAVAGMTKFVGVFSKDARQATQGANSTISIKGNRMRMEDSLGKVEIIDLNGRRFIHLDLKNRTYSTMTFEEMRAQIEQARKKATEQQAKRGKTQPNPQVKLIPKIEVAPGNGTKHILNYTAKEVKTRVELEIQSQDPDKPGSVSTWMTADSWMAPVKGYEEVRSFYIRMAKELDWVPGAVLGGNPQMNMASVELRKSTAKLSGLPLLQYTSVGMGAPGSPSTGQQQQSQSTGNPISKGLGSLFGKKKKDENAQEGPVSSATPSSTGSLMDMTTEVTSVSTSALDSSLFEIPAGFKQVESKGIGR